MAAKTIASGFEHSNRLLQFTIVCSIIAFIATLDEQQMQCVSGPFQDSESRLNSSSLRDCYLRLWDYFKTNNRLFVSEVGADALKAKFVELAAKYNVRQDNKKQLFVDVGANVGQQYELYERFLKHKQTEIHLIEPMQLNYETLQERFGDESDVRLYKIAASNTSGTATFTYNTEPVHIKSGLQWGRLLGGDAVLTDNSQHEEVVMDTLDNMFRNYLEDPSWDFTFLKTDTEGYDYMVMLGAKELLARVRFYLFECHKLQRTEEGGPGSTHYDMSYLLSKAGFDVYKLSARQFIPFNDVFYSPVVDDPQFMHWQNCFALKRDEPMYDELISSFNTIDVCRKSSK